MLLRIRDMAECVCLCVCYESGKYMRVNNVCFPFACTDVSILGNSPSCPSVYVSVWMSSFFSTNANDVPSDVCTLKAMPKDVVDVPA